MPTAYVNQDDCIGCESCVEICPAAFHMTGEGKAEVLPDSDGTEECIQEAMDTCPAECIHWRE